MKPKDNGYIENVLIKLRRQYSKDEYVSYLLNQIKEKDFNIGVLTSERDELRDIIKTKDNKIKNLKQTNASLRKGIKETGEYMGLMKRYENLKKKVDNLNKLKDALYTRLNSKK